jgi:malate synthase
VEAQHWYDAGELQRFDPAMRFVREGGWRCAPVPPAVADRTIGITGPAEPRKTRMTSTTRPTRTLWEGRKK